jgi:AraC family transcriptional regulator
VAVQEVPAGDYACATHVGPYSELPQAWSAFLAAIPTCGRAPVDGTSFEIYRNDCVHTAPEELITELYHPVAG